MVTRAWSNRQARLINQRLMPPMAQFNGIVINIWKNRKVHSDVNIMKMNHKSLMAQFNGIVINIWKNRKVHSDEKLYVITIH